MIKDFINYRSVRVVLWTLIFSLAIQPVWSHVMAGTPGGCSEKLQEAKAKFDSAAFADVISLLEPCLQGDGGDLKKEEKVQGYELLAKTYSLQGLMEQAKPPTKKLLELSPSYAPDVDRDPPPFVELVNQVKKEMAAAPVPASEPFYKNTWVMIGGGVLVAGAAILLLSGSKSSDTPPSPLPGPPAFPPSNSPWQ